MNGRSGGKNAPKHLKKLPFLRKFFKILRDF